MINILLPVAVIGGFSLINYSVNKLIKTVDKMNDYEGISKEHNVELIFEKFLKKVDDIDKASIWLWLPLKESKGCCGWKTIDIKGNEDKIREFLKTNNYNLILSEKDQKDIDLLNITKGNYKFWVVPSMNLFKIDYIND